MADQSNTDDFEIWKDVPGYEGAYIVSSLGNVMSLPRSVENGRGSKRFVYGRRTRPNNTGNGYRQVSMEAQNKAPTNHLVHRLVAAAFLANPYNKLQVNHIDGDKGNNRVDNLEWVTGSENMVHAHRSGLIKTPEGCRGIDNKNAKLNPRSVQDIRRRVASGESMRSLALCYGVSHPTIKQVVTRQTWAHVT